MADIEIEIDGQVLNAQPNQTVIQVADAAGIYIPRFCYHKHLSVPANCRMCLVEVEKAPKPMPACATPVMPGMKVFTKSPKTLAAQRAVMEFLLINHPLDCPICDQGGECELQDLSMGYGASHSEYNECKRAVADDNLGPLIATEMTRCILCSRCIRFGEEVAGIRELGMTFRGEHEQVTTFVQHTIQSEISGNIIDLCPVGALTSKPYRFTARPWELDQADSVSPHDCLGSNLKVHTRYGKVMRVVTRENEAINQTWLSDRDRFSYTGLYHAERLDSPRMKVNGQWQNVSWQVALDAAAAGLQAAITQHGPDQFGALASPQSTMEEFYLLQKLVRALGSPHIDHRLREIDMADQHHMPLFPGMQISLTELEQCDAVLLIGSDIQKEQPLAALRLRKACLRGAKMAAINPVDYVCRFPVAVKQIVAPHHFIKTIEEVLLHLKSSDGAVSEEAKQIADLLQQNKRCAIILGAAVLHHTQASILRYLAQEIAGLSGATLNLMTDGGNTAGAWLAGAIPHREPGGKALTHAGLDAYAMLQKPRKAYLLLNVEPTYDTANAALARSALKHADFVIALSLFQDKTLEDHADIILPMAAFTESAGTYVNAWGEWQTVQGAAKPFGEARPAWKILRVLANFLQLSGFDYESPAAILQEIQGIKSLLTTTPPSEITLTAPQPGETGYFTGLSRIGDIPLYAVDSLVRRAAPLQAAQTAVAGDVSLLRIHPETAAAHHLSEGEAVYVKQPLKTGPFNVVFDTRIAKEAVWLAGGMPSATVLGDLFGRIEIERRNQAG